MKKFLKQIIACTVILTMSLGVECTPISASGDKMKSISQMKEATMYTSDQAIVYNAKRNVYDVKNLSTFPMARSAYSTSKNLNFKVINVTATIDVDMDSGRILQTYISKSNNNYFALFDVHYNNNKFPTIAYLTITVYEKTFFGKLGQALETRYITLYSGGPR